MFTSSGVTRRRFECRANLADSCIVSSSITFGIAVTASRGRVSARVDMSRPFAMVTSEPQCDRVSLLLKMKSTSAHNANSFSLHKTSSLHVAVRKQHGL
jgi:hypothetical protein